MERLSGPGNGKEEEEGKKIAEGEEKAVQHLIWGKKWQKIGRAGVGERWSAQESKPLTCRNVCVCVCGW